jgi:hypothetical protein
MKGTLLLLLAATSLAFVACGDSTSGPSDSGIPEGMTCKINGTTWSSSSVGKSGSEPSAYIVGTAEKNGLSEIIGLQIDSVAQGRTIQLGSDSLSFSANSALLTRADGTWKTRNGSGTLTITELGGGRVKGTFAFTLYKGGKAGADSLKVTDGTFNSRY